MCETLRPPRSRGRSAVPLIRFRCLSAIRSRRSFFVLIFITRLPASRYPLSASRFPQSKIENLQLQSKIVNCQFNRHSTIATRQLLGPRFPGLLLEFLAGVADALLLV